LPHSDLFYNSEKAVHTTYNHINANGLKQLTSSRRTMAVINHLLDYLSPDDLILDLACGYGRVTIPLAKMEFNIKGIDLSIELLTEATYLASQSHLPLEFTYGSMLQLQKYYKINSFTKIICLWLSFNHLLTQSDQVQAVNEIYHVLQPGGFAIIEMLNGELPAVKRELQLFGQGEHNRVQPMDLHGTIFHYYIHNKASFSAICDQSFFSDYNVRIGDFGYESRLLAFLYK